MACSSSALIQVSSRLAQPAITPAKSQSRVTLNLPERMVRRSERETWKWSSGMIARFLGSTQNRSSASRLSAMGKMPVAYPWSKRRGSRRLMGPELQNLVHLVLRAAEADAGGGFGQRRAHTDWG